jgi:hypothetical protein
MPTFVAHIEVEFDADSVGAGGKRLHELTEIVRSAGFTVKRARVEPLQASGPPSDSGGWTQYTPGQD